MWLDLETAATGAELLRQDLEPLRTTLGATSGFAAVELALDCWQLKPSKVRRKVRALLDAHSGYEAALIAVEVLETTLDARVPEGVLTALRDLSTAVIDRLDDRWQRWLRALPILIFGASPAGLRKLAKRLERLLATEPDDPARGDRGPLENALEAVRTMENTRRAVGRLRPAPRRTSRPRRRRPAGEAAAGARPGSTRRKRRPEGPEDHQLDLDLG